MKTQTDAPISFTRNNDKTTVLHTSQWLPGSIEDVFDFFSRPENLQKLTPSQLRFTILTPQPIVMSEGMQLDYKLKVHGLPLHWTSLISVWDPPYSFTDVQLKGPYKKWEHSHRFAKEGSGTRVEDYIIFRVPGGRLIEKLIVQKDLASIFGHRQKLLKDFFPG